MKLVYKIMILAGLINIVSAASNDDMLGSAYPTLTLVLTAFSGLALLVGGMLVRERVNR